MKLRKLLIANRGEIAIRIARAAAELGIETVAVYSEDDRLSLHVRKADAAQPLAGLGAAAYLDIEALLEAARVAGCDAVHPGYGFLSESAAFAQGCLEAGLVFVGPATEALRLFGDKSAARALAQQLAVPTVAGTAGASSLAEMKTFFASPASTGAMVIKAVMGGGGRGMRVVTRAEEIEAAYAQCRTESRSSFGSDDLYAERLIGHARHVEIQVVGDGSGAAVSLGDRECSLQRRHQKLVEFAPSPGLSPELRAALGEAALRMARAVRLCSLATFEFLVDANGPDEAGSFWFIEANPRLQVEHTVTEMVTGVDLVQTQLRIAGGASLEDLGLDTPVRMNGLAVQLRINLETPLPDGSVSPGGGVVGRFEPPSGPGVRVDHCGYAGYSTSPRFDSLLAKLVVHTTYTDLPTLLRKADRALAEFRIDGVPTNKVLLHGLLHDPVVHEHRVHTGFVEAHMPALLQAGAEKLRELYVPHPGEASDGASRHRQVAVPPGCVAVDAPTQGTLIAHEVAEGDTVQAGQALAVIEAMKMQHIVEAPSAGTVQRLLVPVGEAFVQGATLIHLLPVEAAVAGHAGGPQIDLDLIRPEWAENRERHAYGLDENRPEAVAKRRAKGQRTARENIADLLDGGSMVEYGALAIASQRSRRSLEDLMRNTPADGIIVGVGHVNAAQFDAERSRCLLMAYDYTVLAGTQGRVNHDKTDRALHLAEKWQLPVVLFAEGGGGRPGEVDSQPVARLQISTFARFARLSALVPRVGIVSGYSFAGNAALLGCCDVIIATRNASFGMAGPAMIEGGGLGRVKPSEVGPVSVQAPNGVIDVLVHDEAEAVAMAKRYLAYFQGPLPDWQAADQRLLRHLIPENRTRVYDIRAVIDTLADTGSVLELRRDFGIGIVTTFIRIEGQPFGLIANNPRHLGGAIDSDAADKAARFLQLCDAFDLPVVSLCDTPGFMVGPAAEQTALVRHVSRMFIVAANVEVPVFSVVLRKAYGLGAQAMTAGGFHESFFTVAWPTGEVGAMGLEGSVRLGYRKELEAIADPAERHARYQAIVQQEYERGKAVYAASFAVLDDVIDPAETRAYILAGWRSTPAPARRKRKKRAFVDAW